MGSQFIYILIALMLLMTFMMIKNTILENQLMMVIQSQEYYNASSLAQSVIDNAWLLPFNQLDLLHNTTTIVTWSGVEFTVFTTVTNYTYLGNTDFKLMEVNVTSALYNVSYTTSFIFSDIK
jgi:hypothetical protein